MSSIMSLVVEELHPNGSWRFLGEWESKELGRPTDERLAAWRATFNNSLKPGGINAHVGVAAWASNVRVRSQITGLVRASATAPVFEVQN